MSYNIEEPTLDISNYIEKTSKKKKSKGQLEQISKDIHNIILRESEIQNMIIDIPKAREDSPELLTCIYIREMFNNLETLNNGEQTLIVLDVGFMLNGETRTFLVTLSTSKLPNDYLDVLFNMFKPNQGNNETGVYRNGRTYAVYSIINSGRGELFQLVSFCKEGGMLDYNQHYITVEQTQNPKCKNEARFSYESVEVLPKILEMIKKMTCQKKNIRNQEDSIHPYFYIPKKATLLTAIEYKSLKSNNKLLGEKIPYIAGHLINLDNPKKKLFIFDRQIGELKKNDDDEDINKIGFLSQVLVTKEKLEKKQNLEKRNNICIKTKPITKDIILINESAKKTTKINLSGVITVMEYPSERYFSRSYMGGKIFLTNEKGFKTLYRFHNEPSFLLPVENKKIKKIIEGYLELPDDKIISLVYPNQGNKRSVELENKITGEISTHLNLEYVLHLDLFIHSIEEWDNESSKQKQYIYYIENDNDFYIQDKFRGNVSKILDAFLNSLTKEDTKEWCEIAKTHFTIQAPEDFIDLSKDIEKNLKKNLVKKIIYEAMDLPPLATQLMDSTSKWIVLNDNFEPTLTNKDDEEDAEDFKFEIDKEDNNEMEEK